MAKPSQTVGAPTLSKVLMLTPRRIQQLTSDGVLIKEGRGKYPLIPNVQNYIKYWQDRAAGSDAAQDPNNLSAQAEKARLVKFQANKAELEYHLLLGEIARSSDVIKCVSGYIADCVARLMSMPNKLGPIVFGAKTIPKTVDIIRTELNECVSELAGLNPDDYIKTDPKIVAIAASAKSKRVVRSKSKTKPRRKRGTGTVANK